LGYSNSLSAAPDRSGDRRHRSSAQGSAHRAGQGDRVPRPKARKTDADRWNDGLAIGAVSLGLLAIVFAVCSLILREERLLAGVSTALGVGAIAFELAIVAIGALILIAII
jgi:hypothetical protein